MALTNEEIVICNLALGMVGEYQISSSATSTKQYELCERYYDEVVKDVLSDHTWNEAKKRAFLLEDATAPVFGFSYRFPLPTDCIKVIRLGDGENDLDFWEVEDGYILSNIAQSPSSYTIGDKYAAGQYITYNSITYSVDTGFTASDWTTDSAAYLTSKTDDYAVLKIEYIYNLTDTTKWSVRLKNAIAENLAAKISVGITNDPKTKFDLMNQYESLTIRKARSADAQQGRIRPIFKSSWWRSRFGR
jgi:hypothetical protein